MSFYGNLLGWRYCVWDEYMTIDAAGKPAGGIRRPLATEDTKAPRWLPYLFVPSADEAADEAHRAGGEILVPPTDTAIPEMAGRFALISDPLGADFAVYEDRGAVTA
jgi:predicted enzyme related to lactoylglutathione lyase